MNLVPAPAGTAANVLGALRAWPGRLSGRLKKRIVHFDQTIAAFRQRRWS
jgi:hypothetical protein